MTAPPSLFAAILSIGNRVGGEEVAEEKKMRRENSFLSLWVPPLALSSYLGSHAGPLNGVFLNPQNPNLDPPQLLTSFPALPIRVISQSQIPSELGVREQGETEWAHRE